VFKPILQNNRQIGFEPACRLPAGRRQAGQTGSSCGESFSISHLPLKKGPSPERLKFFLFIFACPKTNQKGHPVIIFKRPVSVLFGKIKKLAPPLCFAKRSSGGSDSFDFLTLTGPHKPKMIKGEY
jgi:hypothetical protein